VTGLLRFGRSLRCAGRGLGQTFLSQPHFRFEVAVAVAAIAAALRLQTGVLAVLLACAVVLAAELLNTAIESLVDLLAPDPHPLAARAKDAAAGAVLVASGLAFAVGVVVFGPPLWVWVVGWSHGGGR
jgi:diacylglycerol kinase (ATP)